MIEQLAFDIDSLLPPRQDLPELWTPDDIFAACIRDGGNILLSFKEDNRIEWKSARFDPRGLGDYYSMWANTQPEGGLIVIGVENDGTVSGCRNIGDQRISEIEDSGRIYCPDARYDARRISVNGGTNLLIVLRVFYRDDSLVETIGKEAFYRSGKNKVRLTEEEKREFRINKGQVAYELEEVGLSYPSDFDSFLIAEFCTQFRTKRALTSYHTIDQILCLNHLGKLHNGAFKPNLACGLLFAKDPTSVIPGARLRFTRFEGTDEKTGQQYNAIKDAYVDGPLPKMIQDIEQLVSSQIRDFTRLGKDGKFYTKPEYPSDVWLEAIINACVHRSYNLKNMNVFIKMFDDRLVIESPGGFPPPVNANNIYDTHNPRNPHLMNALFYLDYVKCAHEGTRRMRDMMRDANLPAPEFTQKEIGTHQVHVFLRNNITARKEFMDSSAIKLLGQKVFGQLSPAEKQIINYVAENGRITVSDTFRILHNARRTAKNLLEGLVSRSILVRVARSNNDPKAHYIFR